MANFFTELPNGELLVNEFPARVLRRYGGRVPPADYKVTYRLLCGMRAYEEKFSEPAPKPHEIKYFNEYRAVLEEILGSTSIPERAKVPLSKEFNELPAADGKKSGVVLKNESRKTGEVFSRTKVSTLENVLNRVDEKDLYYTLVLDAMFLENKRPGMKCVYTLKQIAIALGMIGKGGELTGPQRKEITERLIRQNATQVSIKDEHTGDTYIGSLTPCKIRVEGGIVNGEHYRVTVEQFDRSSVCEHSEALGEVEIFPLKAIQPPPGKKITAKQSKIARLMRKRLAHSYHNNEKQQTVKYAWMMEQIGERPNNRSRLKQEMSEIADHLTTEVAWIREWYESDVGVVFEFKTLRY